MTADDWIKAVIGLGMLLGGEMLRRQAKRSDDQDKRFGDHVDDCNERGTKQGEDIARLQERQNATTGWMEALDKRLEAGFDKLEKKIDAIGSRRS